VLNATESQQWWTLHEIGGKAADNNPVTVVRLAQELKDYLGTLPAETSSQELRQKVVEVCNAFPRRQRRALQEIVKRYTWVESPNGRTPGVPVLSPPNLSPLPTDGPSHDRGNEEPSRGPAGSTIAGVAVDRIERLRGDLQYLRDHRIFDWAYSYRDLVFRTFDEALEAVAGDTSGEAVLQHIGEMFRSHAQDIFDKGYIFKIRSWDHQEALLISTNGIQRFLDLPIEYFTNLLRSSPDWNRVRHARTVCSYLLHGILSGYGQTVFGPVNGFTSLAQKPRSWVHTLPLMMPGHLQDLATKIPQPDIRNALTDVLGPVLRAVDLLSEHAPEGQQPLPSFGEYIEGKGRLEMVIESSGRLASVPLEIHCYFRPTHLSRLELQSTIERGVALVVAPLSRELQEWVDTDRNVRTRVVNTSGVNLQMVQGQVHTLLANLFTTETWEAPLTFNFARKFPLTATTLGANYRVNRTSVRDLIRTFESDTGVRLWCSVRRSGKTTSANHDLLTSDGSRVVFQTMLPTGTNPNDGSFSNAVQRALTAKEQLKPDFLGECLREASGQGFFDGRLIFVLDEYEILFERLRIADQDSEWNRYHIVLPLLSELHQFSQQNLVLFIGMRPNAHHIVQEHNQLIYRAHLDQFPLFAHTPGRSDSEFSSLVQRVLQEMVQVEPALIDRLHAETGGHPFLTVNLLRDFCDWLIEKRTRANKRNLTFDDFDRFAPERLVPKALNICQEYGIMRDFLKSVLATPQKQSSRWVHTVVSAMRLLVDGDPVGMACPIEDLCARLERHPGRSHFLDDLLEVITSATQANFLRIDGNIVRPRIPLLARIAQPIQAHFH
jgi:hypothetical protein